jgi:DNA ligase (NAD+)
MSSVQNTVIPLPTHCPSCNSSLVLSQTGIDLYCPNIEHCPQQVTGRLTYFCQKNIANITGLSEKQINRLHQELGIKTIADLFDLDWQAIVNWEGFGAKSVQNLQQSIQKTRAGIMDYKFLAGLSIEGVGPEVAKLICQTLNKNL